MAVSTVENPAPPTPSKSTGKILQDAVQDDFQKAWWSRDKKMEDVPSEVSDAQGVIDLIYSRLWLLRLLTTLPFLILYAIAAAAFLIYFLYVHYLYMLAAVSVAYLFVMAMFYAFSIQFGKMKIFMAKMFHRVIVDLPRNIVMEMRNDINDTMNDIGNKAHHIHGKLLDFKDDVHDDLKDAANDLLDKFNHLVALHQQKTSPMDDAEAV
mmetsp:Transcript_36271/g.72209  ORF Transcript_36271/g.72209 Transcript_36271/m.72209 type:complete len:209 (+) Transcript_36271:51-677(+)|eukprot:CAMPEP_0170273846 /NCGR_PEP_ID=MMETSP0116_2-20130129/36893_1 /TAXON_ID=400756 /ORGANISM="Durinskia baltica, Strain CSIRO CS-38" /LENGTH=208 /DNA_ID=CAMNT_0010525089 /DNA_START=36 /DNA_END=662 /DNA_ORIENTATION=+